MNTTLKHPTKEQAIANTKKQLAISLRAIKQCTRSAKRYEWHLTQIEEAKEELAALQQSSN
jgi:hypothetical protein